MLRSWQFTSDVGLGRVAVAGFAIGFVMALHVALWIYWVLFAADPGASQDDETTLVVQKARWDCVGSWAVYMVSLCFFHFSEFILTAEYKPATVTYESFLLNHSSEYHGAIIASWIEFWIEFFVFPAWKTIRWINYGGFVIVAMGQVFRILAMATAGSNFSHRIEYSKREDHQLVTHGVYRFIRHPSYLGWFYWSVGTQLLLGNPLCTLAFTFVSWTFFRDRIAYEEHLLCQFFPREYPAYRQRSISGVPFI